MNPESQLTMTQAERDAFKNDAATLSLMVSRLEADCVTLRDQLDDITEERDKLRVALKENLAAMAPTESGKEAREWAEQVAAWQRRAEAAERERDELRAGIEVHARVLRDSQVSSLRDQLSAMADARDAAIDRANALERDAAESRVKLDALSAFVRGGVSALVRG